MSGKVRQGFAVAFQGLGAAGAVFAVLLLAGPAWAILAAALVALVVGMLLEIGVI